MIFDAKTTENVSSAFVDKLKKTSAKAEETSGEFIATLRSVQDEQSVKLTDRFASRTSLQELDTLSQLGAGLGAKFLEKDPTLGEQLQASYQEKLAVFQGTFGNLSRDEGIANPEKIQFKLSASGTLQVAGNPPQLDKIKDILNRHPELGDLFSAAQSEKKAADGALAQAEANKKVSPQFNVLFDGLRTQMEFERKMVGSGSTNLRA